MISSQLSNAAAVLVVDNFQPVSSRIRNAPPKRLSNARALRAANRSCATSAIFFLPAIR